MFKYAACYKKIYTFEVKINFLPPTWHLSLRTFLSKRQQKAERHSVYSLCRPLSCYPDNAVDFVPEPTLFSTFFS